MTTHVIDIHNHVDKVKKRLDELSVSDQEIIIKVFKKTIAIELEYVLDDITKRFLNNCEVLSEIPIEYLS